LKILFVEGYHQINVRGCSSTQDQRIIDRSANDAQRSQMFYNLDVILIGQGDYLKLCGDIMLGWMSCFASEGEIGGWTGKVVRTA
jgi:hypothetical protein